MRVSAVRTAMPNWRIVHVRDGVHVPHVYSATCFPCLPDNGMHFLKMSIEYHVTQSRPSGWLCAAAVWHCAAAVGQGLGNKAGAGAGAEQEHARALTMRQQTLSIRL